LNKKIRNAQLEQFNYILVVGDKEQESATVNVRIRDQEKELGVFSIEQFLEVLEKEKDILVSPDQKEAALKAVFRIESSL
jgi:threonyl-tRNA synthetase